MDNKLEIIINEIKICEKSLNEKEINFASIQDLSIGEYENYRLMLSMKANIYDYIKEMLKINDL